jgi:hypothetical protein
VSSLRDAIDAAKARLPLPMLLAQLGLEPHAKRSARCPLHEDRNPSFSVFLGERGWRWKCHAGCGEGDEIGFLEAHLHTTRAEAVRRFCEMGGQVVSAGSTGGARRGTFKVRRETSNISLVKLGPASPQHPTSNIQWSDSGARHGIGIAHRGNTTTILPRSGCSLHPSSFIPHPSTGPRLPDDARILTNDECEELAALRHLSPDAPWCAGCFGTLFIGTVVGFRCWIVTDERRLCAEARRMDGQHFPAIGSLGERKAHTLKGSVKNWPVGLVVGRDFDRETVRAWLAVEGGPDYLAAMHFIIAGSHDCLPIAFLGAGTGRELHPEALPLLRRRRVRFYPHADANGAGLRATQRWCEQLRALGCTCDAVDFTTLPAIDGVPIKDLNDCTRLGAAHTEGLLP